MKFQIWVYGPKLSTPLIQELSVILAIGIFFKNFIKNIFCQNTFDDDW